MVEQPEPDLVAEGVGFDVVVEPQGHEIAPFFASVEAIDGNDPLVAALIERPDDGASDEAGGTSDENCPAVRHRR